jgi:hypothetical protein
MWLSERLNDPTSRERERERERERDATNMPDLKKAIGKALPHATASVAETEP